MNFAQLHQQNKPFIVANVWDASSTCAAQQAGYQALGTSSAAIADMLGYADGEAISFDELFYVVSRIQSVATIPLSVDIEAGFGQTAHEIAHHLKRLAEIGVVGVNIEDSKVIDGVRQLLNPTAFADRLAAVRHLLAGAHQGVFINVRTDTYLLSHEQALQETLARGRLYQQAGADGLFVPCLTAEPDICTISREMGIPLNVMCMPELPDFDRLAQCGVKRISMGNFVHSALQTTYQEMMKSIQVQQSFSGVFK